MPATEIDAFYETHRALYEYLLAQREVTFANEANNNFRRSLVLAIASYFEHQVTEIVREVPRKHADGHPFVCELIEQKAVARQYHTYFDWEGRNANKFFALFGSAFRDAARALVQKDDALDGSIRAFLELGDTRNRLVHLNFVAFDVDKTPEDIMVLYRSALSFLAFLKGQLLTEPARQGSSPADQGEVV
jgi:HEPN superfamily RiboL-PSP-like protein